MSCCTRDHLTYLSYWSWRLLLTYMMIACIWCGLCCWQHGLFHINWDISCWGGMFRWARHSPQCFHATKTSLLDRWCMIHHGGLGLWSSVSHRCHTLMPLVVDVNDDRAWCNWARVLYLPVILKCRDLTLWDASCLKTHLLCSGLLKVLCEVMRIRLTKTVFQRVFLTRC